MEDAVRADLEDAEVQAVEVSKVEGSKVVEILLEEVPKERKVPILLANPIIKRKWEQEMAHPSFLKEPLKRKMIKKEQ